MKKHVEVVEVEDEGLVSLLGETVTIFCNYFYTGKLVGVNDTCILLENPSIIYETGDWSSATWSDSQKLPNDIYIQMSSIESFGVMK